MKRSAALLAIAAGLAVGASACVLPSKVRNASNSPIDPNSPVARDVAYASKHPGPYPSFSDIPSLPDDLRPASAWRAAVMDTQRRRAELDAQVAALPPPQTGTEAYAAQHRAKLAGESGDAAPPDAAQQTEAFAQSLRERATPPPPPK
jgi:hypothetical protein